MICNDCSSNDGRFLLYLSDDQIAHLSLQLSSQWKYQRNWTVEIHHMLVILSLHVESTHTHTHTHFPYPTPQKSPTLCTWLSLNMKHKQKESFHVAKSFSLKHFILLHVFHGDVTMWLYDFIIFCRTSVIHSVIKLWLKSKHISNLCKKLWREVDIFRSWRLIKNRDSFTRLSVVSTHLPVHPSLRLPHLHLHI
jgi:hypothetical protein